MTNRRIPLKVMVWFAAIGVMVGCAQQEVSFTRDVHPILRESCLSCHSPGGEGHAASGFSVQSYDTIMQGTRFGPVINPGSSMDSTIIVLLEHRSDPAIHMPRAHQPPAARETQLLLKWKGPEPLPSDKINTIKTWIDQGAKNN